MNPDVRFLFQRLQLVMDLMNSGWPSRTYPGIPPAAVENGEEQPCMGCSRGVGGVPLLRWAGRSGRGEHRRRKTQRTEERRVGKEGVSTGRYRGMPYH